MTGTFINVATIIIGGALGMLFGARLPERVRQTVVNGLGLFCAAIGVQMAVKMQQPLVVLGSLLLGGILGEWWQIEAGLTRLGAWLEKRFASPEADSSGKSGSRFIRGFLTASLVYCIGPMAILGSIQDGLKGDYNLLAIKAVMDGFASLAFASSLGLGVLFSSLPTLVYQGGISLLAAQAAAVFSTAMTNEMTATGGILLLGISISGLLEIKSIRVGNFLPALVLAPLAMYLLAWLHVL